MSHSDTRQTLSSSPSPLRAGQILGTLPHLWRRDLFGSQREEAQIYRFFCEQRLQINLSLTQTMGVSVSRAILTGFKQQGDTWRVLSCGQLSVRRASGEQISTADCV
ncbi:hypothetical protein ROHU_018224 [Labeo rohita]|uniref:Uncharacterized protein n=1 Tax=Labeo rohita TaxID=84645 RepID=A0A498N685_LABRO|nr:hypothetical protein ROHU_018224 [Labeo rohita]